MNFKLSTALPEPQLGLATVWWVPSLLHQLKQYLKFISAMKWVHVLIPPPLAMSRISPCTVLPAPSQSTLLCFHSHIISRWFLIYIIIPELLFTLSCTKVCFTSYCGVIINITPLAPGSFMAGFRSICPVFPTGVPPAGLNILQETIQNVQNTTLSGRRCYLKWWSIRMCCCFVSYLFKEQPLQESWHNLCSITIKMLHIPAMR